MTHPAWEQLVDYAEGRLPGPEARTIAEHLRGCGTCSGDADWLAETIRHLSDVSMPAPPPVARAAAHAAFAVRRNGLASASRRRWSLPPIAQWAAVAVMVGLVMVILLGRNRAPVLVASVAEASGSVNLLRSGAAAQPAAPRQSLAAGDRVVTGEDGRTRLVVANGAVALTLAPATDVRIQEIQVTGARLERMVARLDAGTVLAMVRGPGELTIATPAALLKTRSGTFSVHADEDERVTLEVTAGEVNVSTTGGSTIARSGETLGLYPGVAPRALGATETPSPEPTASANPEATGTAVAEPTAIVITEPTATPTAQPTATATAIPQPTATPTPPPAPSDTPAPVDTPEGVTTATPSPPVTATPGDDGGGDDGGGDDGGGDHGGGDDGGGDDGGGDDGGGDDGGGDHGGGDKDGGDGGGDDSGGDADNHRGESSRQLFPIDTLRLG